MEVEKQLKQDIRNFRHRDDVRSKHDLYVTDPKAVECLLNAEQFNGKIWECACGLGHISKVLKERGFEVYNTDLIDYGYEDLDKTFNFLTEDVDEKFKGNIITNPPFKYAFEFVNKSLDIVDSGYKVAMFLRLSFLESKKRLELFKQQNLKTVHVFSKRVNCSRLDGKNSVSGAVAYAWYVWQKDYKGDTVIKWINN